MMKKLIINSLITVVALGGATVALAQDTETQPATTANTETTGGRPPRPARPAVENRVADLKAKVASSTEKRQERMEDRKERIASTTERMQEKREEMKDRLASSSEKRQERVEDRKERMMKELKRQYDKMLKRIEATIQREETLMGKLNDRIAKIKAAGGTTAEAEKMTADAKVHIDAAKTDLASLKLNASTTAQTLSTTTNAVKKENLDKMREIEKGIEKHLKEAHKLLEKAVGNLRGMSQLKNGKATTTPTATTTGTN